MTDKGTQTVKRQGGGGGVAGNVKKALADVNVGVQGAMEFKEMPVVVAKKMGEKIEEIKSKTPSS